MLINMIDNSYQTHFHSNPSTDLRQTDEWIQIKLPYAMQNIKFSMSRRRDGSGNYYNGWNQLPNNVDILVSDDGTTWNKVTNVSQPDLTPSSEDDFASYVDLGGEFQYLRFVVRGTVDDNGYFNISEMQIYKAIKADAQAKLKVKLNDLKTATVSFLPGTDPGFYATDPYNALMQAFNDAEALLAGSHSDAEYTAMMETLQNAYTACVNSKNAMHDGYYYIKSAYKAFKDVQPNTIKAMYATASSTLAWSDLDMNLPKYVFHITKQTDGNYLMQNLETQEYTKNAGDNITSTGIAVSTTETPKQEQYFIELGYGQFKICNTLNVFAYNVDGNNSGSGTSGRICTANSAQDGESAWLLTEITDQSILEKMKEDGTKYYLADKLQKVANEGENVRQKTIDYTPLITKSSQISSNAQSPGDGSSYANLIDGNTESIFHSIWDGTMKTVVSEGLGWHNLQFALPYAINKMKFNYIGRNSDSWADSPDHITIYGTNDDALGGNTAAADSALWTQIADLTKGFPANGALARYTSPILDLGGSFKYLRFAVKHTTNEGKQSERTFVVPEITGVTFNLSEMQIYDGEVAATSEYKTVSGMKDACDALSNLIQDAQAKISSLTATQADIDAIMAAIDVVNKLYVDRDNMDSQMAALLDSAQIVYNNAIGSKITLITNVNQISTNSMSVDDGSALINLIDGDINTVFHSHWDTAMGNAETTVDSWAANQETFAATNNNIAVGTGYHNLQIKLNEPVKNFYFYYYGRRGTDYHDSPNDIEILATNNDALGASVNAAESDQWNTITELKDGFPEDIQDAQYTSPNIDLGNSYKYIRFVIKGTTHMNTVAARMFAVPEITGITWNVEEWQMYSGLDPKRVQYNYNPDLKTAVDAMKILMDADSQIGKHNILSTEPITNLRTAINNVLIHFADTTNLVNLYKRYTTNADSSIIGTGIGFVDSQAAIDAFKSSIKSARTFVNPLQPTNEDINRAKNSMNAAFNAFMTHIGQIIPNQWYNIISGSDYPYAQNQPIYIGNTSTGTQLKVGGYILNQIDPKSDPYSIWRFVPVQGKQEEYAIQNMGTGQYFGAYRGLGADNSPLMSHVKTPYLIQYYGNGKFKLIQAGVSDDFNCLKADGTSFVVLNFPSNDRSQQSWKFEPIQSDQELSFNTLPDNSIQIITLPFENKGSLSFMGVNDKVKTYAIKSITVTEDQTKLELKLKNDFEAGEPFIMTINDYTHYDPTAPSQPISFAVPSTVIDSSTIVANGLVGTLQGITLKKPGLGIIKNSELNETTTYEISIPGRTGYINPNLVTNQEGDADLVIESGILLTDVKSAVINKATDKVCVYTIDGKLLKKNIKATDAQKGLSKGLYIIGKNKIAVK
jgi:hypothetical protein